MKQTHEELRSHSEMQISSSSSFGWVFACFFLLVGIYPLLQSSKGVHIWALVVSIILILVTVVKPDLLSPLNRIWCKFGVLLQKVTNPILMGIMLYLIFTPIGLILRILGKDVLSIKLDKNATSYWKEAKKAESMKRMF